MAHRMAIELMQPVRFQSGLGVVHVIEGNVVSSDLSGMTVLEAHTEHKYWIPNSNVVIARLIEDDDE